MPKERQIGRVTPVRAIVSAGRGLPALPAPRGVVEAVVSTACVSVLAATSIVTRIGERARGRERAPPEDRRYGAMRSVSVSV